MQKYLLLLSISLIAAIFMLDSIPSSNFIRNRVVKLAGEDGSMCSAVQIISPNNINYLLSAGHCKPLTKDGNVEVEREDGTKLSRHVVQESPDSDLLLIEGLPGIEGLKIAKKEWTHEALVSYTRGNDFKSFSTEGVIIQESEVKAATGPGDDSCAKVPKNKIIDVPILFGLLNIKACVLDVVEMATTVPIVPGSSGGAVVNFWGQLVGIASASDEHFGYIVKLSDIQNFLKGY